MNYRIFFLLLTWSGNAISQQSELKQILQKKVKVYKSYNAARSLGLNFSITYPASFKPTDIKHISIVKGFASDHSDMLYMVGVSKSDNYIPWEKKKNILSKQNMEDAINQTSKGIAFLDYKGSVKINGLDAAFIEFRNKLNDDVHTLCRQYFVVYNEYVITLSFTIFQKSGSEQASKRVFENYKTVFELIAASYKIENQHKNFSGMTPKEKVEDIKNDIIATDKNLKNQSWNDNLYRNKKYEFRIEFPKNWEYDSGASKSTLARALNREKAAVIFVMVTEYKSIGGNEEMSAREYEKNLKELMELQNIKPINFKLEKGSLNNFPAFIVEMTTIQLAGTKSQEQFSKQIQCRRNLKLFTVGINLSKDEWTPEMSIAFDRVVESFKFEIAF